MNFKELQTEQKLRGGYYTPEDLADFLTRWVAGANPESILEPSCGDGVFFNRIASHMGNQTVATYIAVDPENDSISWSLSGDDSRVFSITEGALTFKESPDFEEPEDVGTDNEYKATVTASDGSLSDEVYVTVTVTNVEEPGKVTLNLLEPQVGTGLTTIVTDPDGGVRGMTWEWESSSDNKNTWTPINGAMTELPSRL